MQLQQSVASCFLHHSLGSHTAGSKSREDGGKHMAGPYGSGLEVSSESQQETANLAELPKRAHPIWSSILNYLSSIPYTKPKSTHLTGTSAIQLEQSGWDIEQHPERAKGTIISCCLRTSLLSVKLCWMFQQCWVCCISGRSWKDDAYCRLRGVSENIASKFSTKEAKASNGTGICPHSNIPDRSGKAGPQSPHAKMDKCKTLKMAG